MDPPKPPAAERGGADRYWGMVRVVLWRALHADDAAALADALRRTRNHEGIPIDALVALLSHRLWPPEHPAADRCGLLAAAATRNRYGAPVRGAVRCVRYLLTLGPASDATREALRLCGADGVSRPAVEQALLRGPARPFGDPAESLRNRARDLSHALRCADGTATA